MTDMRATERLLEVIEDRIRTVGFEEEVHGYGSDAVVEALKEIHAAITELRRRGDTLVRAEDLRLVLASRDFRNYYDAFKAADSNVFQAFDRLENTLGGKMR